MTVRDPRWIGAWWLGFIVFGISALVVSIPLMCFPKRMPSRKNKAADRKREEQSTSKSGIKETIKGIQCT